MQRIIAENYHAALRNLFLFWLSLLVLIIRGVSSHNRQLMDALYASSQVKFATRWLSGAISCKRVKSQGSFFMSAGCVKVQCFAIMFVVTIHKCCANSSYSTAPKWPKMFWCVCLLYFIPNNYVTDEYFFQMSADIHFQHNIKEMPTPPLAAFNFYHLVLLCNRHGNIYLLKWPSTEKQSLPLLVFAHPL